VFIGSSTEGLPVAEAIQQNLDYACDTTVWSQGIFGLGEGSLEALVDRVGDFDFAVLVLTPDDVVTSRGKAEQSARDNVLLELGLFLGAIGRKRTFIVYDRTANLKLPSDLAGVTPATYQRHRTDNLQAALGACCTKIKNAIEGLGVRPREKVQTRIDEHTQFQVISALLEDVARQFIILMHEKNLSLSRESMWSPGIRYEFWRKGGRGGGMGGFSVDGLCKKLPDADLLKPDLHGRVSLTPRGHEFAMWLTAKGEKAAFFQSSVGKWGRKPRNVPSFPGMSSPWDGSAPVPEE